MQAWYGLLCGCHLGNRWICVYPRKLPAWWLSFMYTMPKEPRVPLHGDYCALSNLFLL
jgi:hypothetical protein